MHYPVAVPLAEGIGLQCDGGLDAVLDSCLTMAVRGVLPHLYPRYRLVLILHFGLDGKTPLTYREIGLYLGVSGARVQQMQNQGLRQLRHPGLRGYLIEFI